MGAKLRGESKQVCHHNSTYAYVVKYVTSFSTWYEMRARGQFVCTHNFTQLFRTFDMSVRRLDRNGWILFAICAQMTNLVQRRILRSYVQSSTLLRFTHSFN